MSYFRQDLLERLEKLDLEASLLFETGRRFQCVLVGGSALVLKQHVDRSTHDIDLLQVSRELLPLLEKYDMNTNVTAHLDNFADSWPERVQLLDSLETRKIDYFVPALEDLIISKLAAHRPQDMFDISEPNVLAQIDWHILDELAAEVVDSMLSERQISEFKSTIDEYREKYQP
ncbi:hypothetical protein LJC04_05055 [Ruminococcaceae bacterium OttesenSCG-928-O06]|nr:hypothetical protein [Ruminococcaceae bacterium OttesenSCG-928-O06]